MLSVSLNKTLHSFIHSLFDKVLNMFSQVRSFSGIKGEYCGFVLEQASDMDSERNLNTYKHNGQLTLNVFVLTDHDVTEPLVVTVAVADLKPLSSS